MTKAATKVKDVDTFNEKIRWIMKNDRNQLMVTCSDKLLCKEYIESKIGKGFTPKTYTHSDSVDSLVVKISGYENHPSKFFLKSNNDSGGTALVEGNTINKSMARLIERHKMIPYGANKGEWWYQHIKYQCFTEEFLGDNLIDYKFHCSLGVPRFCQVIRDRHLGNKRKEVSVDMTGNILDFHFEEDRVWEKQFTKPESWSEMVKVATRLSEDFRYVRVDVFNTDIQDETGKGIFVGELTFAPRAGKTPGVGQIEAGKILPIFEGEKTDV